MQTIPSLFNLKDINPVVRLFIISDFFIVGGLGLITPIFALFVTDFIEGATIETVGLAMTIYLITKSVGQTPIGIFIDRWRGQKDDMLILILSSLGFFVVSISYMLIDTVLQLYIVQFFYGFLAAASFPTWVSVFTRSVDKGKEGFEWSIYQTMADFGAAITAAVGSFIAANYGFNAVFILMATFSLVGTISLISANKIMFGKHKRGKGVHTTGE